VGTEGFIPPEGPGTVQADIYSLGKVLYEISTGKDRNDYPELPTQLGNTAADRDLIELNKIVLKACRSDPKQRYKTAEEMMTALLSFQFVVDDPAREKRFRFWTKVAGIGGAVFAFIVIVGMLARIIWLLRHSK
jgi:serine/threonine protein kinase